MKSAKVVRKIRNPEANAKDGVRQLEAVLLHFSPPLVGSEYVIASHILVDKMHEVAFFPGSTKSDKIVRLTDLATVRGRDAATIAQAIRSLGYKVTA